MPKTEFYYPTYDPSYGVPYPVSRKKSEKNVDEFFVLKSDCERNIENDDDTENKTFLSHL